MPNPTTCATRDRVRVCVVGSGRIAEEHLSFLARSPRVNLMGVCDLDPLLARRAASAAPGVASYTDYRAMLADLAPTVVHVVTPATTHAGVTTDACDAGARLVILEKPATLSHDETVVLLRHAESVGALITEDHNYLYNPPTRKLLAACRSGQLGALREVDIRITVALSATRYKDAFDQARVERIRGGVIREFLPHLAYLALAFAPSSEVQFARWDKRDKSVATNPDDLLAVLEPREAEEPRVVVRFSSGVAPATTSLTVYGDRGSMEADLHSAFTRARLPRNVGPALSPLADQIAGGLSLAAASGAAFRAKLQGSPIYSGIPALLDATYDAFVQKRPLPVTHKHVCSAARISDEMLNRL